MEKLLFNLRKWVEKALLGGEVFARVVLFALMVLITTDVLGRYCFNRPIQGSLEISEFLMVALVFLSLGYLEHSKQNIRVTLIISRLPVKIVVLLNIISDIIALFLWAFITWKGADAAIHAWQINDCTPSIVPLPLFPAKALVPIGGFMLCIQLLFSIWDQIKNRKDNH